MDDADQLRGRATRLFALALKAQDDGHLEYAEELTKLASEAMNQASDMERRLTPAPRSPNERPAQQQQPQPKADDKEG
jgi:hypothetical protein